MKRFRLLMLLVAAAGLRAEPLNPKYIASDAVWVAHIDLDMIKNSQSGMGAWLVEKSHEPQSAKKIAEAKAYLGFDLRNDLAGVTAYGLSENETQAVALLSGSFNPTKLAALLGGLDNYNVVTNSGCEIHSWNKKDNPVEQHYAAFHGTNLVAFASDGETLTHAVKVLLGKGEDGSESTLMKIVQGENMLTAAFQSDKPLEWPQAGMLKSADAGVFSLAESNDELIVKLMLNVTDAEQAKNLGNVAEGLRAMAMLSAESKPKAAELAKQIIVDKHDKAVSLTLQASSDELIKMLEESEANKGKRNRKPFK